MNNLAYLKGLLGVMGCCGLAALFSVVVLCGLKETGTFRNKKGCQQAYERMTIGASTHSAENIYFQRIVHNLILLLCTCRGWAMRMTIWSLHTFS